MDKQAATQRQRYLREFGEFLCRQHAELLKQDDLLGSRAVYGLARAAEWAWDWLILPALTLRRSWRKRREGA